MSIKLTLLLVLTFPVCAWSQAVTATLLGTVTDASGATVPNAEVTATETSTGVSRRTVTNTEGIYTIPYLSPGSYRVEVEAKGFKKFLRENIELRATISTRVDTTLEPGQVSEVVEVRAESPLLQTDRSEVSRSFNQKAVTELPLADRSFQFLVGLMPGIAPPSVDFTRAEDPQGTTFSRANGQGNSANNTQVDGLDNTNPTLGLTIYIPSAEVVQEVNITTTNYNAEFGRAGGAILNVVTRGGTNELHGRYSSSTATAPYVPVICSMSHRSPSRTLSGMSSAERWAVPLFETRPSFSAAIKDALFGSRTPSPRRSRWKLGGAAT
jgi:hypothetical protein